MEQTINKCIGETLDASRKSLNVYRDLIHIYHPGVIFDIFATKIL